MYEEIVVHTALYGNEAWLLEKKVEKLRIEWTWQMSCLKNMCGVTRRDSVK